MGIGCFGGLGTLSKGTGCLLWAPCTRNSGCKVLSREQGVKLGEFFLYFFGFWGGDPAWEPNTNELDILQGKVKKERYRMRRIRQMVQSFTSSRQGHVQVPMRRDTFS